jgi:hypothetical protein
MSHVAHELNEEFPDKADKIHELRQTNAHFAKLANRYHEVNRAIHRMETNVEPTDDVTLENAKKERLLLIDDIRAML